MRSTGRPPGRSAAARSPPAEPGSRRPGRHDRWGRESARRHTVSRPLGRRWRSTGPAITDQPRSGSPTPRSRSSSQAVTRLWSTSAGNAGSDTPAWLRPSTRTSTAAPSSITRTSVVRVGPSRTGSVTISGDRWAPATEWGWSRQSTSRTKGRYARSSSITTSAYQRPESASKVTSCPATSTWPPSRAVSPADTVEADDTRSAVIAAGSTVRNTGSFPATLRVSPADPATSHTTPSSSPAPESNQPRPNHTRITDPTW